MKIGPPPSADFYPFAKLEETKQRLISEGVELIDMGVGDPLDDTPEFIRRGLADAITPSSSYPKAAGLPELRQAISSWIKRRFDSTVDQENVLPTLGSKETIHSLPAYLLSDKRNLVGVPRPSYPVYERGAEFHGGEILDLPLSAENNWLPDLSLVSKQTWERTALVWLNYPHNPTGARAPLSLYEEALELANRHGFVLAVDDAYSEIYFDEKPCSALQLSDHTNLLAINTLSKRSCMTGYRSAFLAGDPKIIGAIRKYRPSVGVAPQEFVQKASVLAWNDETHVQAFSAVWRQKREILMPVLQAKGLEVKNDATFFLWVKVPDGYSSDSFAYFLLDKGIVVVPGTAFGESGQGYVRFALVPTLEDCVKAAELLAEAL